MAGTEARPTVIMNGFGGQRPWPLPGQIVGRATLTQYSSRRARLTRHVMVRKTHPTLLTKADRFF